MDKPMNDELLRQEIKKNEKFIVDKLRPDLAAVRVQHKKLMIECDEFGALLLSCAKIKAAGLKTTKMKVDLGQQMYVTARVDDCNKIVVKLEDGIYAELTLDRAIAYSEKRIELLKKQMEVHLREASFIEAHITFILSSMDELIKSIPIK